MINTAHSVRIIVDANTLLHIDEAFIMRLHPEPLRHSPTPYPYPP